jgi:hypothetical protein
MDIDLISNSNKSVYKNEKRKHNEAFEDNISSLDEEHIYLEKRMKY